MFDLLQIDFSQLYNINPHCDLQVRVNYTLALIDHYHFKSSLYVFAITLNLLWATFFVLVLDITAD